MSMVFHLFRIPGLTHFKQQKLLKKTNRLGIQNLETESCFNILATQQLNENELNVLSWLLAETFEQDQFGKTSFLKEDERSIILEVGPRLSFTTAWSTNAVTICHACELHKIQRIERSTRYLVKTEKKLNEEQIQMFLDEVHDRMTECRYIKHLDTFTSGLNPQSVQVIPLLENGKAALEEINKEMGLAFDEQDIDMYLKMFTEMGRNPTNVELFDLSQSNSEHSRHWFFRGRLVIDGKEVQESLMDIVKQTLTSPNNSVLAFCDNSSAITGYSGIKTILPQNPQQPSPFYLTSEKEQLTYDLIFTAETHNFPTGVAPFPGAETGTGGRLRDVHATGKGALVIAGTSGYCVGNLNIPGYPQPWEDTTFQYPKNIAAPLKIEIDASNGASDYGNKFGEPVIQGFTRSFGMRLPSKERREWLKPIMFTGGIGQMDHSHAKKDPPKQGMVVVKLGGPAYRIGMGGGAASSLVHGENKDNLDFNAVQRGDAEMEQKLNRVIKACVELRDKNPIVSIHDQGAGGSGNVLKEIVDPEGAFIEIRNLLVGDETLSVLELWGAEYQENDALLVREEHKELFQTICKRERTPVAFVGRVTGDGRIIVHDARDDTAPVNLELERVLGKMPAKVFHSDRAPSQLVPLELPHDITVMSALSRVLSLLSVGSKLFLTNKVDRSVSGLIAQQQCVGPLQLPLSNVAVVAQSHFGITGGATAIGEQPIKGLLNHAAMARMTVGEMMTNLVWAQISSIQDIKCSGNWMWAAKLPGEGAAMYDTAVAMRDIMLQLGVAIDGGKDSLSMAARAPGESAGVVKAPGTLVVSGYVTCPDITKTVTPNIKNPGHSTLILIDIANGKYRTGGSALAQVYNQLGNESPDVDNVDVLMKAFQATQQLLTNGLLCSGHDRSDGGLITTLVEMAFAGNCGFSVTIQRAALKNKSIIEYLFAEELGLVYEVKNVNVAAVTQLLSKGNVPFTILGQTTVEKQCHITFEDNAVILSENMTTLRDIWNATSHQLELLQANPECVQQETSMLSKRKGMKYHLAFKPSATPEMILLRTTEQKHRVAIIREEGSNGDREMAAAFFAAGFSVWDIHMSDLISKAANLNDFVGVAFVGGFSYADVMDSAKGWSGGIKFNQHVWQQFETFYHRPDTFSLGVCNGCQLMALLGWVPFRGLTDKSQPRFIHNVSGRYESRFSVVKISESPAMMLKGMEGCVLGVWVAHGEGRAYFNDPSILDTVEKEKLAPIRYVNDDLEVTQDYPFNPNGSVNGIASLCSRDGRHLAMMPHPERSVMAWQWPHYPANEASERAQVTPWIKIFQNAREFCDSNKK